MTIGSKGFPHPVFRLNAYFPGSGSLSTLNPMKIGSRSIPLSYEIAMSKLESISKFTWKMLPKSWRVYLKSTSLFVTVRNGIAYWRFRDATHDEIYDASYFEGVDKFTLQSADMIAESILSSYSPTSIWDVGCGTGALLECLRRKKVSGRGLELAEAALAKCHARQLDVRRFNIIEDTLTDVETADVVVSMEVGAQLPSAGADRYVDLLCNLGAVIVFSSEAPGGGDRLVLNEQPKEYWIEKFAQRGFVFNDPLSRYWREQWSAATVAPWFSQNVMVFEREKASQLAI